MNRFLIHFVLVSAYNVYQRGKVKVGKLFDRVLQVMVYSFFPNPNRAVSGFTWGYADIYQNTNIGCQNEYNCFWEDV